MGLFAQIKKGEKRMLQNTSAGLSEAEAKARLAKVGENRLRGKKGASVAAMFFSQFKDLMILILAAATLISVLMGEGTEAITIIIIVLMNATMGFLQEYRTEKTLEALKELSAPTARVRRSGRELEVGARTVVPGDVLELWDRILKDYDELVYIPMSSGLSSSCETAVMLAQDYGGRVQVVNNQRISVTLRQSALDAQDLAAAGRSAAEIKALLEQTKFDSDIYITVDTLKYLKKGGRCTPAAAAIGTVLNLKPVLRIKGEKLDSFAKARGWKAAKKTMLDTARRVMETDFAGCRGPEDLHIAAAFTGTREEAQEWLEELEAAFPGYPIHMDPLSLSVACHIGPGARAVTLTKALPI